MAPSIQPGQGDLPPLHAGSPMEYKDGQIHFDRGSQSAYVEVNVKIDDHTTKTLKVTVHGVATEDDAIKKVNETLVKSVAIAMMHFDTGVKKVTIDNEKTIKHTETETESKSTVIKSAVNLTSDLKTAFDTRKEQIEKKEAGTLGRKWEGTELKEKTSNLETAIKIAGLGSRTSTPGPAVESRTKEKAERVPADDSPQPLEAQRREALEHEADLSQFVDTSSNEVASNEGLPEARTGDVTEYKSKQLHSMLEAAQGFANAISKLPDDLKEQPQPPETTNTTQPPAEKPSALEAFNKAASESPISSPPPTSKRPNEGRPLPPIPGRKREKIEREPGLQPREVQRRTAEEKEVERLELGEFVEEAAAGEITDHSSTQLHSMLQAAQGFANATSKLPDELREQPQPPETTNTTQPPAEKPSALEAFTKAASESPISSPPPTSKRPNEGRPLPPIPGRKREKIEREPGLEP